MTGPSPNHVRENTITWLSVIALLSQGAATGVPLAYVIRPDIEVQDDDDDLIYSQIGTRYANVDLELIARSLFWLMDMNLRTLSRDLS